MTHSHSEPSVEGETGVVYPQESGNYAVAAKAQ
jgi:hypothetical protein